MRVISKLMCFGRERPEEDKLWKSNIDRSAEHILALIKAGQADIFLSKCNVGPRLGRIIANELEKNGRVEFLDLSDNKMGPELAEGVGFDFGYMLKVNKGLRKLDLARNQLGHDAAKHIFWGMQFNCTIKYLDLSSNNIGPDCKDGIETMLKNCSGLEKLNLSNNRLGSATGIAIFNALRSNRTLSEIGLSSNEFDSSVGYVMARVIEVNESLKVVDIEDNDLGPSGEQIFSAVKDHHCNLEGLYMRNTGLDKAAGLEIAWAIQRNKLETLSIGRNNIGEEAGAEIMRALEGNNSLRRLFIEGIQLGPKVGEDMAAMLHKNERLITLHFGNNSFSKRNYLAIGIALWNKPIMRELSFAEDGVVDVQIAATFSAHFPYAQHGFDTDARVREAAKFGANHKKLRAWFDIPQSVIDADTSESAYETLEYLSQQV